MLLANFYPISLETSTVPAKNETFFVEALKEKNNPFLSLQNEYEWPRNKKNSAIFRFVFCINIVSHYSSLIWNSDNKQSNMLYLHSVARYGLYYGAKYRLNLSFWPFMNQCKGHTILGASVIPDMQLTHS